MIRPGGTPVNGLQADHGVSEVHSQITHFTLHEPGYVTDAAGFDLRPNPLHADTPAALAAALREYWIWAGRPSFRELARRAGGTPAASTICTMLGSSKLPTFGCMLAFLTACGATDEDCQRFATTWRRLSFSDGDGARKQQMIPAPRGLAEGLPDHQD
jgi:hypothetical protein